MGRISMRDKCHPVLLRVENKVEFLKNYLVELEEDVAALRSLVEDRLAPKQPRRVEVSTEEQEEKIEKAVEVFKSFTFWTGKDHNFVPAADVRFVLRKFHNITLSNKQMAEMAMRAYGIKSVRVIHPFHKQIGKVAVCYPCIDYPYLPEHEGLELYDKYLEAIVAAGLYGHDEH